MCCVLRFESVMIVKTGQNPQMCFSQPVLGGSSSVICDSGRSVCAKIAWPLWFKGSYTKGGTWELTVKSEQTMTHIKLNQTCKSAWKCMT